MFSNIRFRHALAAAFLLTSSAFCPAFPSTGTPIDPARANISLDEITPAPQFPAGETKPESEPSAQAQRYLKSAEERFNEGLWADATTALERALKIDPGLVRARTLLARTALQHGNTALAESHLKEAVKRQPRDAAVHQLLGEIAVQNRKAAEAIGEFRLALMASEDTPRKPERVLAQLSLGLILKEEGYLAAAADRLEAFIDALSEPTPEMRAHKELEELTILYRGKAARMLAELYSDLGRYDKAIKAYQSAAEQSPDDKTIQPELIRVLSKAGKLDEAIQRAGQVFSDSVNMDDAVALLEETCNLANQPDRVNEELIAIARRTKDRALLLKLSTILIDRGRESDASEILADLTGGDEDNAEASFLLAQMKIKLKQPDKFIKILQRLLANDASEYPRIETLIAEAHAAGIGEKLSRALSKSAGASEKDAGLQFLLACNAWKAEDSRAAMNAAAKALELDETFAPAAALLARMMVAELRWDDALAAVDKAIADGLITAELHSIKGRIHDALDEHEKAETAFLEAFRLDRKNPDPLFYLAESIERRGLSQRCEQLYRRILDDVEPRCLPARERLVRLLLNGRKTDLAKEYFSDFERLGQSGAAVERSRALLNLATSKAPPGDGKIKNYREDLRRISKDFADEAETHVSLAMSYEAVGEIEEALAEAQAALALEPGNLGALERRAEYLTRQLDFAGAAESVKRLLEYRPRDAGYLQRLVRLALCQGDMDAAAAHLRTLLARDDPPETKAFTINQLVAVLRYAKRFDESIATARDWLDLEPEDAGRRELYLAALRAAERMDDAVAAAKEWLAEDPASGVLRRQYVAQLLAAKKFIEAQQRLLGWLAAEPDDLELNRLLVRTFWELKDWNSAIETVLNGMEDPRFTRHLDSYLGLSYRFAGRWDEAVELYRRRTGAAGERTLDNNLVDTLIDADRFEEAEKVVSSALDDARGITENFDLPGLLRLRRALARIYQLTDRREQAFQQLEEIFTLLEKLAQANRDSLEVKEQFIGINNDLGYTYAEYGVKLEKAEKMIRLAVAEEPLNGAYIDSLGWVAYKRGHFDSAARLLSLAVLLSNSDDAVMFDHLGDSLYRAGREDDAKENWEKALELSAPDRFPPPIVEDRRVHDTVKTKLKALAENENVETAALAEEGDKNTADTVEKKEKN